MRLTLLLLMLGVMVGCRTRNTAPAPKTEITAPIAVVVAVGDTLAAAPCDTLRLGRMRSGEVIEQSIGLRNDSHTPMVITRTETSCGCTALDYTTQPVAEGDTVRIGVRFDSQGFYGWQFKRVRVYTSADVRPITFYIEAEVE